MLESSMGIAYISLLFLLCIGFALYETGYGVCSTITESIIKRLASFVVSLIAFTCTTFIFDSCVQQNLPTFILNLALVTILTHIVTSMARSLKFSTLMSVIIGGVIYPAFATTVISDGILAQFGYYDVAGSGIVHFVGAVIAILMSLYFSRFGNWDTLKVQRPAMASLGFLCIWAAWLIFTTIISAPFITTDPSAWIRGFIVASTAAGWGAIAAVAVTVITLGKTRLKSCTVGGLAGLVIVSADPFTLSFFDAVWYGIAAGVMSSATAYILHKLKLKDPCSVISVHGPAGAVGILLVSLTNSSVSFSAQLHGLAILCILAAVVAVVLCEIGVVLRDSNQTTPLSLQR